MRRRGVLPLVVTVVVLSISAFILGLANSGSNPTSLTSGQKKALTKALEVAPNPACNPGLGAGRMGACSPPAPLQFGSLLGASRTLHGILGVDVSSYQGCSNSFRGVRFVITKFNESTGYHDPCAAHNIAVARSRNLLHGGYDFLRPGRTTASAEAATFVGVYRATRAKGVAVADVEVNNLGLSSAAVRAYVKNWVYWVHRSLPHATVIIYTGAWFWNPQVRGSAGTSNLWVSAYANSFLVPTGFHSALMWQYSDGTFGPHPHLYGWDSDVFLGNNAKFHKVFSGQISRLKVKITKGQLQRCAELNKIRRRAHRTGKWSPKGRGKAIKRGEAKHHLQCTRHGLKRA